MRGTAVVMATHNYDLVRKANERILKIEEGSIREVDARLEAQPRPRRRDVQPATASTRWISGISRMSALSSPARSVMADIGHVRQVPVHWSSTVPFSLRRRNFTSRRPCGGTGGRIERAFRHARRDRAPRSLRLPPFHELYVQGGGSPACGVAYADLRGDVPRDGADDPGLHRRLRIRDNGCPPVAAHPYVRVEGNLAQEGDAKFLRCLLPPRCRISPRAARSANRRSSSCSRRRRAPAR